MMELNDVERAVMELMLAGDHPTLNLLRNQLKLATLESRKFTGVGFYTHFTVPDHIEPVPRTNFIIGDVLGEIGGLAHGAGFWLFIKDGFLSRHLLCCEQNGHALGKCPSAPTEKMWSFRQEYFCAPCRSYHFGGNRARGYMTARYVNSKGDSWHLSGCRLHVLKSEFGNHIGVLGAIIGLYPSRSAMASHGRVNRLSSVRATGLRHLQIGKLTTERVYGRKDVRRSSV